MGFISDLLRTFGFTSEDDDQDNELEDDPDRGTDVGYDDEGDEDDDDGYGRLPNPFDRNRKKRSSGNAPQEPQQTDTGRPSERRDGSGNVIRDPRMDGTRAPKQTGQYAHCERVVKVRQLEECREIIEYIVNGESVLLNLEDVDPKYSGRVVDLLSGAAFALRGRMVRIAHLCYLLAPEGVQIIEADTYAASRARYH